MDRERATTFAAAAIVLALAGIALLAIDRSRDHGPAAPRSTARPVAPPPPPPSQAGPQPGPATTVATAARRFATDWLDYLAGRRPASSVRSADPSLLVAFAGGGERDRVGPGRRGLRGVRCDPPRGARRECRAIVAGLPPIRFTLATDGRPRVIALALD